MKKTVIFGLAVLGCLAFAACEKSPTNVKPQFDDTTGQIGDPCNPDTYSGPYRCIPDSTSVSGYIIAY